MLYIYINCDNSRYMLVYSQNNKQLMNYSGTCQLSISLFSDDLPAIARDCEYNSYFGAVCTLS